MLKSELFEITYTEQSVVVSAIIPLQHTGTTEISLIDQILGPDRLRDQNIYFVAT